MSRYLSTYHLVGIPLIHTTYVPQLNLIQMQDHILALVQLAECERDLAGKLVIPSATPYAVFLCNSPFVKPDARTSFLLTLELRRAFQRYSPLLEA